MLEHVQQRFEHSWRERNGCSIQSPQEPFRGIELKRSKFVDVTGARLHRGFRTIQKNSAAA